VSILTRVTKDANDAPEKLANFSPENRARQARNGNSQLFNSQRGEFHERATVKRRHHHGQRPMENSDTRKNNDGGYVARPDVDIDGLLRRHSVCRQKILQNREITRVDSRAWEDVRCDAAKSW
jgi:hypothetical protein